jgi:hypothetical protein
MATAMTGVQRNPEPSVLSLIKFLQAPSMQSMAPVQRPLIEGRRVDRRPHDRGVFFRSAWIRRDGPSASRR